MCITKDNRLCWPFGDDLLEELTSAMQDLGFRAKWPFLALDGPQESVDDYSLGCI